MGKARDEAGNIWETDAQGNPVRMIQPAQSNPMNNPFVDPRLQYQVQDAAGAAAASRYEAPKAQAEAAVAQAQAPYAGTVAEAQARKAEADAKAAEIAANGGGVRLDASTRAAAIAGYNYSKQLQGTIDELRTLYTKGPGSTKGVHGLEDYLPYTQNQTFNTKANAARGIVGQTLGFTGGQLNTEKESEKAIGPYLPQAGDKDAVILQKIETLQGLANDGKAKAIQILGGEPDANGNIHPVAPASPAPQEPQPPAADPMALATSGTRDQVDPVLKAASGRIGAMIAGGAPDAEVLDFIKKSGINPADTSIGSVLQFRKSPAFKTWQRQNPGSAYPIGPNFYTKPVPMSPARQLFNKTAATNVGGDLAAYGAAAGNAVTGGRLDNMAASLGGDPAMAQTGMDLLRGQHPMASFIGDASGQALVEASMGRIPGAGRLLSSPWGRRGADALYGAYSGSGENDGDPLTGALTGAGVNSAFGMFGRGAQRGAGRALTGVRNANLGYLNAAGVPLTIGQIGRGSDNVVGKAIGGIEDRITGLPGFDAVIGAARQRGDQGFNAAAFREAGGSGVTGAAGLDEVGKLKSAAYGFLNNTNLPLDAQFAGGQAGVRAAIPGMPAYGDELTKGMNLIDKASANGHLTGLDWQSALSDTKGNRVSIAGTPWSGEAVKGLKAVEDNLLNLADRQGPAGTLDSLNAANKLHGQTETLAGALDNGPTQKRDQLFSAGRLDDVSRTNARNFGGRMASLTGKNRPFYDLTKAGLDVMPNLTPDSGTAGRMLMVPLLTGAGGAAIGGAAGGEDRLGGAETGLDYGLALGLAGLGPYSKTGQKALQKLLLSDRPDRMVKIGEFLVKNPKYAGMFGSGAGRDYFYQPELGQ